MDFSRGESAAASKSFANGNGVPTGDMGEDSSGEEWSDLVDAEEEEEVEDALGLD